MFCEHFDEFVNTQTNRGFTVHNVANGEEAKNTAIDLIGSGSVGCGGSMTVSSLGIPDILRKKGNAVFFHWDEKPEDRPKTFACAASADWYICSSNAITADGKLINIDGNGNRVSAMFNGPKKVIPIVGKNKYASNVQAGYARIKEVACIKNAKRFNLSTPCAITGKCTDCHSPQRLCSITIMIEVKPKFVDEMHLILVDEELGL